MVEVINNMCKYGIYDKVVLKDYPGEEVSVVGIVLGNEMQQDTYIIGRFNIYGRVIILGQLMRKTLKKCRRLRYSVY